MADEKTAPTPVESAQAGAEALKRAALDRAIKYHEGASQHPRSRGAASPTTVTATAREFWSFLRDIGDQAADTSAPDQTAGG